MLFNYISCKNVIGRIIRNTRMTDSSYMDDMLEWIPEVIDLLRTHYQLVPTYKVLEVADNCAKIPCGLVTIEAVEHQGSRLRLSNGVGGPYLPILNNNIGSIFVPDTHETLQNHISTRITGSDLKMLPQQDNSYYKIVGNYIQTSFKEGNMTVFFLKRQVDEEGYPMIPDVEDYKQAVYWYVLMMMLGAGYEHHLFKYDDCEARYNLHAARAVSAIKYPTVDKMESNHRALTRLVPPQNYYDNFFNGSEQYNGVNGL